MSSTLLANTMAPAIQLDAQPRRSMIGRVFAIRIFKSRPQLSATWIDSLIVMAKAVGNSGELASVPYVKVAANIVIQILEIIQLARQNRDDFRDLAQSLVNIIVTISETLQSYSDGREPPSTFTARCHAFLERISKLSVQINETVRDSQTWTRYFKGAEIRNMISQYRRELDELRANFTVTSVMQMALRIFAEQNPRQLGYPWECSKPIYFIDAMNIKTSLPMEFCHTRSDFEDLLKFMFRKRRGRRFVERGDYALTNGDAEALNDHNTWHALVKPGTTITMHVVLRLKTRDTDNDSRRCPTCTYFCTHASLNDEVICPSCGTFFRVQRGFVEEEIQGTPMLLPRMNRSTSSLSTTASKATVNDPDFECTDIRFFRRFLVRLEDLSLTDAWSYINTVKTYLPEKCDAFMDILKDFLGHKIDTLTTIEKVVLLFDGYPDVIRGFNLLFPVGYHSDNSTDRNDQPLVAVTAPFEPVADFVMDQYDRARSYLDKVAHRYLDDRDTYKKVLDLFGMYATERLDTAEAYGQAQILFKDSPDLLAEFSSRFLTP